MSRRNDGSSERDEEKAVDDLRVVTLGRLRANSYKPHWRGMSIDELFSALRCEVDELGALLDKRGRGEKVRWRHLIDECGDVNACAAMIADVAWDLAAEEAADRMEKQGGKR